MDVMTKALPKLLFWKLINDITGVEITAAGMKMWKGQYAYRFLKRPQVEVFDAFHTLDMSDFFGEPKMLEEQVTDQRAITDGEEECKVWAINAEAPS